MDEPSPIKESRIDGEEVEADELQPELEEVGEDAKVRAEEDAAEKEEEERVAKLTIRLKGIAFDGVTEADVASWFPECEIADEGIFIAPLTRVAYVEFKTEDSVKIALEKRNFFQSQSISVSKARPFHRSKDIAVAAGATQLSKAPFTTDSLVIHIRFLPYWTTEERIMDFYKEFEILAIHMIWDHIGRTGAQCYVEFNSDEDREKALKKKGLGRHVKFFESDHTKLAGMFATLNPQYLVDDTALVIRMCNLPLNVTEDDVISFFRPIELTGVYVAKDWLGKGTGVGFITVEDYGDAYLAWNKSGHRFGTIDGETSSYKEKKNIELLASCATEFASTLISMYVREKNGLNRGYGRGRGGFRMGNVIYGGAGGRERVGDGRQKNQKKKKNPGRKKNDGRKRNDGIKRSDGRKKYEKSLDQGIKQSEGGQIKEQKKIMDFGK